jgi:hypothetical protein
VVHADRLARRGCDRMAEETMTGGRAETRAELINWLVEWREAHKGSISPFNNRRNLKTWTTQELRRRVEQIRDHEHRARTARTEPAKS